MTDYCAPVQEIGFLLKEIMQLDAIARLPGFEEVSPDLVDAILEEGGRYFAEVFAPTNQQADIEGTRLENMAVVTAPVLDGLYGSFREAGWPSLTGDPAYGGQGMPHLVGFAVDELVQSSNMSFSLLPMLTMGVITALERFGSESQKKFYLPKLISGEWTGTMNLTESQAGSDLAAVRTRALPQGDHYLIKGQKTFISWGDHSYTDNIVHLVLARTPDAPEGVKGISLFVVPKYLIEADGQPGQRNDVYPVGVEDKLGIHASPTCVMTYGDNEGAVGYLIGEENQGLVYMFSMMNHARLAVGLQGVSISERSYQQAVNYAREREQGGLLISHPDVRRMLMTMKALTEGGRALVYSALMHWDMGAHGTDESECEAHQRRVELLTPLVKGWCTEIANEVTSLGVQVHGGMGYVEETGMAQYLRDARIMAIYEGSNGIQAMDLVGRKLLRDRGAAAQELLQDIEKDIAACRDQSLDNLADSMTRCVERCREAITCLFEGAGADKDLPGSIAFNLLMLMGTTVAAGLMVKSATVATSSLASDDEQRGFLEAKICTAHFFVEQIAPRTEAYLLAILSGSKSTMMLRDDQW